MEFFLISEDRFNILYNLLYCTVTFVLLLLALYNDVEFKRKNTARISKYFTLLFTILLICLVGFRDYNVGTDTYNYHLFSWIYDFRSESTSEILFDVLIDFFKIYEFSFTAFLTTVASLFYVFMYKAFKNTAELFDVDVLYIFFIFISLFFSKSLGINVIRQGLSLSFLLYAYTIWLQKRHVKYQIIFSILAVITHITSFLPLIIFIIISHKKLNINLKYYYWLYFVGIILSAAGLGILSFAPFLESYLKGDRYADYLKGDLSEYVVGFKPQFVIFNSIFLLFSYFVVNKIINKNSSLYLQYSTTLKLYLTYSFVFFMMFQIPFSDRFGLFSWILIPLLFAPYFTYKKNIVKYKTPTILMFITIYIFFSIYGSQ